MSGSRNLRSGCKRRVLHLLGALETGGTELRMLDVLRLVGSDFEFEFITLSGRRGTLASEFEQLGATVTPIKLNSLFVLRFLVHLRRTRPHVVQSHVALASGALLTMSKIAGVPLRIAHFHSDGDGKPDGLRRRLYRTIMRKLVDWAATDVIAVSPSALEGGYRARPPAKVSTAVIPNGVDVSRLAVEDHQPSETLRLLSLGRSSPEKNLPRMPRILAATGSRVASAELLIMGPRDSRIDGQIAQVARYHSVQNQVRLQSSVRDIGRALARADILLQTSVREGLPSVVIEAAAVGLPVVCSDVGGARWIGTYFPWVTCLSLGDSDEEWADEILRLRSMRPGKEEAARAHASSPFTMNANLHALRTIYQRESH